MKIRMEVNGWGDNRKIEEESDYGSSNGEKLK